MEFDDTTGRLTVRERGVLQLLAKGMSNREIADQLGIAEITVKNHLTHMFDKLKVSNRTHAAIRAMELGLFRREPRQE